ncbi:Lazarillo protein [Holothuria leucospilota]|uniref:Lazarillo protein n=1 Tax=Holothuria leucospilota TaxID=206669 RepID=A0A9Q1C4P6_HOLLE|nr:Lazarillo protein [Holothuria leucospilota]
MFCKTILSLIVLAVVGIEAQSDRGTVPNLRPECYVGRWYQMYTNFWSNLAASLPNPTCVTADYGAISATNVTVYNAFYDLETQEGDYISGYAFIPDVNDPGKLRVSLEGVPVFGFYWIFKLGPIYRGLYEYSLVTDNVDRTLFILARDPERFRQMYEAEVLEYVRLIGFTDERRAPEEVPHTAGCIYPPTQ